MALCVQRFVNCIDTDLLCLLFRNASSRSQSHGALLGCSLSRLIERLERGEDVRPVGVQDSPVLLQEGEE